jgi:predicted lipoprotein with Yx(FWY)xxD motif
MKSTPTRRSSAAMGIAGSLALAAAMAVPGMAAAHEGEVHVETATDDLGTYLVDAEGMTLYYFTRDVTPGQSVCFGGCLEAWPPLLVGEGEELAPGEGVTGYLGAAPREDDGSMHVTYRGRPLYYWQGDTAPGETNGEGVGEVWYVAQEDGSMPENPPALTLETATTDLGTFLVGQDGLTTYYFEADATPGVSVCEGDCLVAWPPVTVPPGNTVAAGEGVTGVLGLITATDGSTQVTYDGWPLYYWQGDTEAGQTTGHGVNDIWWVADVSGTLPAR